MLTTAENPACLDSHVIRKTKTGEMIEVKAPLTVPLYNQFMNVVDHADQIRTEYSTFRTSRKWWTYMFFFLFDTAIANGLVVMKDSVFHQSYTKKGKFKQKNMLDFRMN